MSYLRCPSCGSVRCGGCDLSPRLSNVIEVKESEVLTSMGYKILITILVGAAIASLPTILVNQILIYTLK